MKEKILLKEKERKKDDFELKKKENVIDKDTKNTKEI